MSRLSRRIAEELTIFVVGDRVKTGAIDDWPEMSNLQGTVDFVSELGMVRVRLDLPIEIYHGVKMDIPTTRLGFSLSELELL